MADIFVWIMGAVFLNSLLGVVGVFSFFIREQQLKKIVFVLAAFSAGALLGGAFFHLLPEALGVVGGDALFGYTLVGFLVFFLIETYFHWHSCKDCEIHPYTYVMLVGDAVHNFIDGLVIAASFFVGIPVGVITTLVIMGHELPQELGLFGVLVHGGQTKKKALVYSYLAQATAIIGGLAGYFLGTQSQGMLAFLLPFAAGGFIYIAASDLIPEMHESEGKQKTIALIVFAVGLAFMVGVKMIGVE